MGCNHAKVIDDEEAKKKRKNNKGNLDKSGENNMDDNTFQEDNSSNENERSEREIEINIDNINKSSNSKNNSNNSNNINMSNKNMNNNLVSEESVKGIYNLYNGEIRKPKICVVSKNVIFNKNIPEDKKPPDPLKLKTKKIKNEENNIQL